MKKNFFIWSMIICCLCNCKEQQKETLDGYNLSIPAEDMVGIIVDLAIAESAITNHTEDLRDSVRVVYKSQIEKIHGYSMTTIDSTLTQLYKIPMWNRLIQRQAVDSIRSIEEKIRTLR